MRQQSTWILRWSSQIIEACWLAAIFCIPSFFNLLTSRHFEPDKALLFRSIVVIMSTFVVINYLEQRRHSQPSQGAPDWWQRYRQYPLILAIVLYAGIYVVSTITSIVPSVSFWGSYQRLQGTYTNLSYIILAFVMIRSIHDMSQIWRIICTLLLSSVIPTLYGYVQYLEMDPLPWKGDVITRVASTLGNSIFIAAYLIMVVPFAVAFGIYQLRTARETPATAHPDAWLWLIGHFTNVIALVAILFGGMQMSAVIRTIDSVYWWIYPGAFIGGFSLVLLLTSSPQRATRFQQRWIIPAVLLTLYTLIAQITGLSNQDLLRLPDAGHFGANWNWWMWAATASAWIGVAAYIQAPYGISIPPIHAKILGYASFGLAIANWITIILSQSRGPWIGGIAGLCIFFVIYAQHQIRTNPAYAATAKRILYATVLLFTIVFGFLLIFNFADLPALRPLRDAPYIGRMGRLFDVSPGTTGDVRMKIWFGDEYGKGAIGLILADPLRTIIGWGPESMFAAYTPHYPPSLANIESRSATPDRSHQAFLDEVVNKGILGLISYLAVIVLTLYTAWRALHATNQVGVQLILMAAISALLSHLIEGLTGIPIVATLMIQWILIGLIFKIDNPQSVEAPTPVTPTDNVPHPKTRKAKNIRVATPTTTNQLPVGSILSYLAVLAVGVGVAWSTNIDNMYADMRFQQGQTYNTSAIATNNSDQQIIALSHYLAAARLEPNQDYYYLNIGRSLLSIAEARRRQNNALTTSHTVDFHGLLIQPDALALKQYLAPLSARDITRYAEETLLRADQLYPLNKDHSANLARLYIFWFSRIEQDKSLLDAAINWYAQSTSIAPNDVAIRNDYAGALLTNATAIRDTDASRAADLIAQAEAQLQRSRQLDQRYRDTTVRLGDLARAKQDYSTALTYYEQALVQNNRALDSQITTIIYQLAKVPDAHAFLRGLRQIYARIRPADDTTMLSIIGLISSRLNDNPEAVAAFAQLTQLQPENLEAQQNYTLVLSNALQYDEAYTASERLYQLAQQAGYPQSSLDVYAALREFFASKR